MFDRIRLALAGRERLPDFLEGGVRFDCDGLAVAFYPLAREGRFFWLLAFQNRFERPCRARVRLRPVAGAPNNSRLGNLPEVCARLECDGGAFGTAEVPSFVPPAWQGRLMKYGVSGSTTWPRRRGRLLRPRRGRRAPRWNAMAGDGTFDLFEHFLHGPEPAVRFRLPETPVTTGPRAALTGSEPPRQAVHWRPGDPLEKALDATAFLKA